MAVNVFFSVWVLISVVTVLLLFFLFLLVYIAFVADPIAVAFVWLVVLGTAPLGFLSVCPAFSSDRR